MTSKKFKLIEPIEVHISQIDKVATPMSSGVSGRRELQNYVERKATIILDAQVAFPDTQQMPNYSPLGVDEQAKGYMVLTYDSLAEKNVTLRRGDKITKIGQLEVEYFILHSNGDPSAHYSGIGGFRLVKIWFSDRVPSK